MEVETRQSLTKPRPGSVSELTAEFDNSSKVTKTGVLHKIRDAAGKKLEAIFKRASKQQSELRILVTGKTGQGKSTLINGILGSKVAKEGARAGKCTSEVSKYSKTINGVPIKVFDSPGLQDRTPNEEEYIRGMREQCQELSLILYCTKMINTRLTDDDKHAMIKLTKSFGEHFWDYAVFVLTFANMENVSRRDDRDDDDEDEEPDYRDNFGWQILGKKRFQRRIRIWKEDLHQFLIHEVGVSSQIAEGIPVVPTGDSKPTRDNPEPLCLPDRDDWFSAYWAACCIRIKNTRLFLHVNGSRMVAMDEGASIHKIKPVIERSTSEIVKIKSVKAKKEVFEKPHHQKEHKGSHKGSPRESPVTKRRGPKLIAKLSFRHKKIVEPALDERPIEIDSTQSRKIIHQTAIKNAKDDDEIIIINDLVEEVTDPFALLKKISDEEPEEELTDSSVEDPIG